MLKTIKHSLTELGFKPSEIKVYIALTQLGEAPASEVASKADLPRTTTISILNKLAKENFLTQHLRKGITYYWVESPHALMSSLETKLKIAGDLNRFLTDLYRSEAYFPHASIYDTRSSIKNFVEKFLANLTKRSVIMTIDAPTENNYGKIFSERVEDIFFGKKNDRGIVTKTLIPFGSFAGINQHKTVSQSIELRELPEKVNFRASIWLTNDMLVHFSGNPPFIVTVRHQAIVAGMRSIFDFLWNISQTKK